MNPTLSPWKRELFVSRWLILVAATLYPLWSLVYQRLFPSAHDPLLARLGVTGVLLSALTATGHPWVARRIRPLMLALYVVLGGHFLSLTAANGFSVEYTIGSFITFICLNVTITSRRYLVAFSLLAVAAALLLARHDAGANAYLFFFGMATIQLVSFISLVWRLNLEASLVRAREVLRGTEANLRRAQEIAQIGSWEWELGSPTIAWSDELFRMTGLAGAGGVPLETFLQSVHPGDRERVLETIRQAMRQDRPFSTEYRLVRPDGSERVVHGQGEFFHDEQTGARRLIGIAQDITERKRADRYKDEFLSVISHELRTPLNFITGFASVLDDEVAGPLNHDQHVYLGKILKGAERMLSLVNNLLDMSRMQAGKFTIHPDAANYPALVREALTSLYPLAHEKRLQLESDVAAPETVWLDDERILQVLTNLIDNAIKFTPEGGRIRVTTRVEGDELVTEVSDSGIGIGTSDLPKLFTRFQQVDMGSTREAGGTGLGLSITKSIVEAHRGRIGVRSDPGQGSTFWFTLPVAPAREVTGALAR